MKRPPNSVPAIEVLLELTVKCGAVHPDPAIDARCGRPRDHHERDGLGHRDWTKPGGGLAWHDDTPAPADAERDDHRTTP